MCCALRSAAKRCHNEWNQNYIYGNIIYMQYHIYLTICDVQRGATRRCEV